MRGSVGRGAAAGLLLLAGALAYAGWGPHIPRASGSTPPGLAKINHFIFIIKENHSFDNYFGRFPGADGADAGRTSGGAIVPLAEPPDQVYPDLAHGAVDAATAVDRGRMDGFDRLPGALTLG